MVAQDKTRIMITLDKDIQTEIYLIQKQTKIKTLSGIVEYLLLNYLQHKINTEELSNIDIEILNDTLFKFHRKEIEIKEDE